MIDLVTTVRANTPEFLSESHQFWVERPPATPFVERTSVGFMENGQELLDEAPSEESLDSFAESFHDSAVALSRRDAERFPASGRSRTNLGIALLNSGDIEEAETELEAAIALDSDQYAALASLARVRILQERFSDAEALYMLLHQNHPSDPNPVMGLADIAERRGNLDEALQHWKRSVEIRPTSAVALFNLGAVLLRLNRHREAISSLKLAARTEVHRATVHSALGVAYALIGEKNRAIRAFRTALSLSPRLPDAIEGLASVLLDSNRAIEAAEILHDHIDLVVGHFEAHELLAQAYVDLGKFKEARRQWFRALAALQERGDFDSPHRARLVNNLGACLFQLRAFDEALKRFQDSIALNPSAPVPYHNLARLYLELGNLKQATTTLQSCKEHFLDDEESRLMLAFALDRQGEPQEAIKELQLWVASDHANVKAWTALGYLLADSVRQPEVAVRVLQQAFDRWPHNPMIINNLAYAHLMNRDPEAARSVLLSWVDVGHVSAETDIVLHATRGLLHLWEGDFKNAEKEYRYAADEAESRQLLHLAQVARQKMHLEFARAYQRAGMVDDARKEALVGLQLQGDHHYRGDLKALAQELRMQAQVRSQD